jgi:hypothetical protein
MRHDSMHRTVDVDATVDPATPSQVRVGQLDVHPSTRERGDESLREGCPLAEPQLFGKRRACDALLRGDGDRLTHLVTTGDCADRVVQRALAADHVGRSVVGDREPEGALAVGLGAHHVVAGGSHGAVLDPHELDRDAARVVRSLDAPVHDLPGRRPCLGEGERQHRAEA